MRVDAQAEQLRRALDRALERRVGEGLDLPAVAADDVVMMVAVRLRRLVAGDAVADVDSLDESECDQLVEYPVDGRDSGRATFLAHALVELLGAHAAGLLGQGVEHGGPRPSGSEACALERLVRMFAPGHADHRKDDSDSYQDGRVQA